MFDIDDVVRIIENALRGLFGVLCEVIYPMIAKLYEIFIELGKLARVESLEVIYNKISLIIGIFMVFRLTFWLIESLVNPDNLKDKENNPGKIIQKVLISVILLATTPTIFDYAFKLQSNILETGMIEKLISTDGTTDAVNTGRLLAAELFVNFYTPNLEDDDCSDAGVNGYIYSNLKTNGEMDNLTNDCLTDTKEVTVDGVLTEVYVNDFNGLFATAVGVFVFWIILMYCISLGTRYVQLIYLQVIAPIPIMCYLAPGKDNMFSKWLKQCTTTYLDVFIRVVIISFILVLCEIILNSNFFTEFNDNTWIIKVFLILGLLAFGKKAPDLVQELLPKSVTKASGDFGLSWKKRTDNMLGGKMVYGTSRAMTYGALGAVATGAVGFAGGRGKGRITGLFGGMARGLASGAKSGSIAKNFNEGIKQQNKINSRNIEWEKNGSTLMGRMNQRLANATGTISMAERLENEMAEKETWILDAKSSISSYKRKINVYKDVSSLKGSIESRAEKKLLEKERPSNSILASYYDNVAKAKAQWDLAISNPNSSDEIVAAARANYYEVLKENKTNYINYVMKTWHDRETDSSIKPLDAVMESSLNQLTSIVKNDTDEAFAEGEVHTNKEKFISSNSDWDSIDKLEASTTNKTQDISYNADIEVEVDGKKQVIHGGIASVERTIKTYEDQKSEINSSKEYKAAKADRDAVGGHKGGK